MQAVDAPENVLPWRWRDLLRALLLITIGTVVLVLGLAATLIGAGLQPDPAANMAATPFFLLGIGIYGVVVLAVYLFAVRRARQQGRPGWQLLGWRPFAPQWIWALPLLLFVQFAGMAVANLLLVIPFAGNDYQNPQIEAITGGGALSPRDLVLLMVLIAVVAPLAEEIFFRGMLYPLLRQRWSMWPAIVVNGLLFSLIHVLPPLLPGLFIVGMVLAWVRERSGSLIPGILLHALQNGVVLWGIYQLTNSGLI
jgi:membrane protease YdiL (CAAX protease family)